MKKNITCIVCPRSCRATARFVDGEWNISGCRCKRGEEHVRNEMTRPMRVLTTTISVRGAELPLLPVISAEEVPKDMLRACLAELYALDLPTPVRAGDVIHKNICGLGVDIVAARTLE